MSQLLNVQPGSSRAALVTYSNTPKVVFSFNDYGSVEMFEKNVDDASFLGGTRRVDKALNEAARLIQQARRDANKIVILLTAGRQGMKNTNNIDFIHYTPLYKFMGNTKIMTAKLRRKCISLIFI